jgi:hypothetical protein
MYRVDNRARGRELICPSCQSVAGIFACDVGQITGTFPRVPRPHEGRFAIVTKRWARDAVDACGAADECTDKRTAKSCGPDIPTLISSLRGDDLAGDGDNKPGSPGRARRKPLKPFAQGRPERIRRTCGDFACVFFFFTRKAAGAIDAPGFPCALRFREGQCFGITRAEFRHGKVEVCLFQVVVARLDRATQYSSDACH